MRRLTPTKVAGVLTTLLLVAVLSPAPEFFSGSPARSTIAIGLDASLRVPALSRALWLPSSPLRPGDRVVAIRLTPDSGQINLETREHLIRVLAQAEVSGDLELLVRRGSETLSVRVPVVLEKPASWAVKNWPLALVGFLYILLALATLASGRHPVAMPMFVASLCIGVILLGSFDILAPDDQGLLALPHGRGRAALLCMTLLPAAVLHFSMRFPVVHPRFRDTGLVAVAYFMFAIPAALGQFRFFDAGLVQVVERVAQVMSLLAVGTLLSLSLSQMSVFRPIERSRTIALLVGIGLVAIGPIAVTLAGGQSTETAAVFVAAGALGPPLALGWAVARYRLLDPPEWLRTTIVATISLVPAFTLANLGLKALPEGVIELTPVTFQAFLIAGLTIVFHRGVKLAISRLAGEGLRGARYEHVLAEATVELSSASNPNQVVLELLSLVRSRLRPADVQLFEPDGEASASPLVQSGFELWSEQGSPLHSAAALATRSEDPGRGWAEVVLPLAPLGARPTLLVASARADGLPYTADEIRIFNSLVQVAEVALGHAATSADLEKRVAARTSSLREALQGRASVLEAARSVHLAESPEDVREAVVGFVDSMGGEARWVAEAPEPIDGVLVAEVEDPRRADRVLVAQVGVGRSDEVQPLLETVSAFAGIALERLNLLADLQEEVSRQAHEIADITATRRHAEFVRNAAHELRKPNEEVYRIALDLSQTLEEPGVRKVVRIASVTREMNRRLDLLLFHSDMRLDMRRIDLVQIVTEGIERSRTADPDRHYEVEHELDSLPLMGDKMRLRSVLENLLDNAVKATDPSGTIRVMTRLEAVEEQDEALCVRLEVEDDGVGIAPEDLEEVFKPGVSRFVGGFGLGLALCEEVISSHGGEIWAESIARESIARESRGSVTRFHVRLPQFPAEDEG